MLVKTINASDLKRAMQDINRDYYSIDACEALVELFAEYGEPVEFDGIAIASDFTEEKPDYIADNYSNVIDSEDFTDEDGNIDPEALTEALSYHTWAVLLDNGNILYQEF